MRWFACLLVMATTARADVGVYLSESIGGGAFRGQLEGGGVPRLQVGFGARVRSTSVELFGTVADPFFYYIDCYGPECTDAPQPGLVQWGADLRRQWPLLRSRWSRVGVNMFLHGGPRWVAGTGSLDGMRGPGLGGGAGIEGTAKLIGYYLDFGVDTAWLHGDVRDAAPTFRKLAGDPIRDRVGALPYVVIGAKLGWL